MIPKAFFKLNNNLHSGSVQTSHCQKKHVKVGAMSSQCWLFFFDCEGVVQYQLAPRRQTINKEYYVKVLKRLRDAVRIKRPHFWSSGDWLVHHDNAAAQSSNLVQQFLAKHKVVQLRQPPYSPDMAPCDFWMFPKLKMALKRKRFDDVVRFRVMLP